MLAQYHGLVDVGLLLTFSLGGLMYYVVFYRSRLIPGWLSAWGIVGVVLLMVAAVLIIFGVISPTSPGQIVLAVPIAIQEMVLAVWLILKGFDRLVLARQSREGHGALNRGRAAAAGAPTRRGQTSGSSRSEHDEKYWVRLSWRDVRAPKPPGGVLVGF